MKIIEFGFLFLIVISALSFAGEKFPLSFDDMMACKRIADPQFSPGGKYIAFTVTTVNESENSYHKDIWVVTSDGKDLRQFTTNNSSSFHPRWSPDGKKLCFLSNRSDAVQIWIASMNGGEPYQITSLYTGINSFIWSKDGKKIAFSSNVYPDCKSQEQMEERDAKIDNSGVNVRVYEELFYRHWDTWWDHKRSHLFVLTLDSEEIIDVTPGDYDSPSAALGSGFIFSPDSKYLYFTSNHDKVIATSTNNDIWRVPVTGGDYELISTGWNERDFKGNDSSPQFSPDGKYLSFLSMKRAGFEADKKDLILKNIKTGEFENITADLDIAISSIQWLNEKELICRIDEKGRYRIYSLNITNKKLKLLVKDGYNRNISISPDKKEMVYLHQTFTAPYEIFVASTKSGKSKQITFFNDELLSKVEMNSCEDFWFNGADNVKVHGFLIKPPKFDSSKKYPMVFMVHGGPQGAWHDGWHFRWNAELWAAQGYVMVLINPRGSTGYGQQFTDQISKDWGGKVVDDLIAGQKYVLDKYKFINKEKIAAAGASFGGFMMNWIEGHMDDFEYPFKTLVNHDGAFNLYSKYLTTEELWFPEWEFDGPFWENDKYYKMFSPHLFIENFSTPMLIIHGEKDYRLDFGEALMPFTALRKKGIPAKLVLFPDEGHWVQKPQNSRFWHKTIFDWLDGYIK